MKQSISRRAFLASSALVAGTILGRRLGAATPASPHPTPRAGITAAKVPRGAALGDDAEDAAPVFDMVREIPEIIDGIRCNCGCAELEGYYSLLSCFEGADAMAKHCRVCQGQGRLAHRMHKSGKSLDEIRKGVDARFG